MTIAAPRYIFGLLTTEHAIANLVLTEAPAGPRGTCLVRNAQLFGSRIRPCVWSPWGVLTLTEWLEAMGGRVV